MPDPRLDPLGSSAASKQKAEWERQQNVVVRTRQLNYRDPQVPREKGIDVEIALALVVDAFEDRYDHALLFSGDTDLVPAVERVVALGKPIEFLAWANEQGQVNAPRLTGAGIRRLDADDYVAVMDPMIYVRSKRP
jgi:hypothetical protein